MNSGPTPSILESQAGYGTPIPTPIPTPVMGGKMAPRAQAQMKTMNSGPTPSILESQAGYGTPMGM